MSVSALGLIFIGMLGAWGLYSSRVHFASLYSFFGPFAYFGVNIGFVLTPAKLFAVLVALLFLFAPSRLRLRRSSSAFLFVPYILYVVFTTLSMQFWWPSIENNSSGWLYGNEGRALSQLVQFGLGCLLVSFIISHERTPGAVDRIFRYLFYSMIFMACWGVYVFFAQLTGLPFPSINRADGLGTELAITTSFAGLSVPRAYSLSGEPKGLAADMVVAITLLTFGASLFKKQRTIMRFRLFLLFFCLGVLGLTLSTAGLIQLPLILVAGALCSVAISGRINARGIRIFSVFSTIAALLAVMYADVLMTIFTERLFMRLESQGLGTYAEDAIAKVWDNFPNLFFTGSGLGGSTFFIREIDPHTYAGKVAAPRGVVGFIADQGLIGLLLFLLPLLFCFKTIYKVRKYTNYTHYIPILVCFILLFFTKQGWFFGWLTIAALIILADHSTHLLKVKSARS